MSAAERRGKKRSRADDAAASAAAPEHDVRPLLLRPTRA